MKKHLSKSLATIGGIAMGMIIATPANFARAGTSPVLSSITLTATSVDVEKPPATLPFSITFIAPRGLQTIQLFGTSQALNTASEAQVADVYYTSNMHPRSDTLSLEVPFSFNFYMLRGDWEITAAEICDVAKDCQYYTGVELAKILHNPKFKVINTTGFADNTPVTVLAGKILTPIVSLAKSRTFEYRLTVAQQIQGIDHLQINYVPPGAENSIYNQTDLPAPVKAGVVVGGFSLPPKSPLGKYTIISVGACPIVFQTPCTGAYTSAAIRRLLGATTFTVTK
jgi:hypothetical protein